MKKAERKEIVKVLTEIQKTSKSKKVKELVEEVEDRFAEELYTK